MIGRRGRSKAWREHQSDHDATVWYRCTYVADDTTNAVCSENIEGIIISEGELELGRKIANGTGQETEEDGGGCTGKQVYRSAPHHWILGSHLREPT